MEGETYHGTPTLSWFCTVKKLAFIPNTVADEMSMISSQKFSCAAGQRYRLVRTSLTSAETELSDEAIIVDAAGS